MMPQLLTQVSEVVNFPPGTSLCGEAVSRVAHNHEVASANLARANKVCPLSNDGQHDVWPGARKILHE